MPRKSGVSLSAASDAPASPAIPQDGLAPNGDTSILSTQAETSSTPAKASRSSKHDDSLGIDDLLLPRTLTSRLARGILPANTSIQKDALLALTKSATVFISALASTANELTAKKTIAPQDVLKALHEMELAGVMGLGVTGANGELVGRLERELEAFETTVKGKRKGYREKVKQRESDVNVDGDASVVGGEGEDRGEPETKRARMDVDTSLDELSIMQNGNGDTNGNGNGVKLPQESLQSVNGTSQAHGHTHPGDNDETEDDLEEEEADQDNDHDHDEMEPDDADENEEDDENENEQENADSERLEDADPDDYGPNQQLRFEIANGRGVGSEDESD